MRVMMKGVGLKMQRMRGINIIWLVQGGRTRRSIQQLVDNKLEGVKLVHEFGFHGVKFVLDLGLELCKEGICRANIRWHMLDGVLVFIDEYQIFFLDWMQVLEYNMPIRCRERDWESL
jgi:hypothetical protein